MWNQIQLSRPPASSSSTRFPGSADSRLASTQPAQPPPPMMKSNSLSIAEASAINRRTPARDIQTQSVHADQFQSSDNKHQSQSPPDINDRKLRAKGRPHQCAEHDRNDVDRQFGREKAHDRKIAKQPGNRIAENEYRRDPGGRTQVGPGEKYDHRRQEYPAARAPKAG